uniref:Zinc finger LSD1-type domain-containing protein n=1 Tax=Hordeum vulgare subsp. vulgare TaxID=112509 RepID=A0A8I6YLE2_HORVV
MAQFICGGCRTLLMYIRSAYTVRCSCCSTVNLVRPGNANSASYYGISSYELSIFMLLIHENFNLSEECGILLIYCW